MTPTATHNPGVALEWTQRRAVLSLDPVAYRDDRDATHLRVQALEREIRSLRRENDALRGEALSLAPVEASGRGPADDDAPPSDGRTDVERALAEILVGPSASESATVHGALVARPPDPPRFEPVRPLSDAEPSADVLAVRPSGLPVPDRELHLPTAFFTALAVVATACFASGLMVGIVLGTR